MPVGDNTSAGEWRKLSAACAWLCTRVRTCGHRTQGIHGAQRCSFRASRPPPLQVMKKQVPGLVPSGPCVRAHQSSVTLLQECCCYSMLQTSQQVHRDKVTTPHPSGPTTPQWQTQDLNRGCLAPEPWHLISKLLSGCSVPGCIHSLDGGASLISSLEILFSTGRWLQPSILPVSR